MINHPAGTFYQPMSFRNYPFDAFDLQARGVLSARGLLHAALDDSLAPSAANHPTS